MTNDGKIFWAMVVIAVLLMLHGLCTITLLLLKGT